MRDPNRIYEILRLLSKIWLKNPDLRLIQLITNCCMNEKSMYYIEDVDLLENLKRTYKEE